jgi:phosphomannomutase
MNDHIYIFDVDGTLTPSRAKMNKKFQEWFLEFIHTHKVYLVTGSDSVKTIEQVGKEVFNKVVCSYNCSGNTKYERGICVMSTKDLELPDIAQRYLEKKLRNSKFSKKTGLHFDTRPGLLNFSIVGRNAARVERRWYVEYDTLTNERQIISNKFNKLYSKKFNIVSQVAGETGLDIIKIGTDKAQILKDFNYRDKIIFFGDNIQPDGNDYGIAQAIKYSPYKYSDYHHVKNWKETWRILKSLLK